MDFNSLDINFNLQTWVVILDFFGIGYGGEQDESVQKDGEPRELWTTTFMDIELHGIMVDLVEVREFLPPKTSTWSLKKFCFTTHDTSTCRPTREPMCSHASYNQ